MSGGLNDDGRESRRRIIDGLLPHSAFFESAEELLDVAQWIWDTDPADPKEGDR